MKRSMRVLLASALLLCAGSSAQAQSFERSRIDGTVADESGGLLPGVTVVVRNIDTGLAREVITDSDGRYVVPGLPPGAYEVRAELAGFQPARQTNVTAQVGQTTSVHLALKVGSISEQVTVVGEAALIETTKTDFSSVVNSHQIDNLPINGRSYLEFATLTPGVVLNQSTAINGIGANVAGARSRNGSVLVDGFNNLDDGFTSPRLIYSQEAIQEFQVLTLGFSAEFGRATGGIVNAITKSGTNNFEGRAFTFFRDKALNARNAFEQGEKAGFRRWQTGGTMGGPIRQDKLFYFGSFERQDFSAPTVVTIDPATARAPRPGGQRARRAAEARRLQHHPRQDHAQRIGERVPGIHVRAQQLHPREPDERRRSRHAVGRNGHARARLPHGRQVDARVRRRPDGERVAGVL